MKKLASVVMVIAITTFIAVAMASAGGDHWRHWRGIHGNYEMVATGACLHDKQGFTFSNDENNPTLLNPYTATPKSVDYFISAFMGEGTWTFHRHGHGTMQVMQYCILPPYTGSPQPRVTQSLMPSAPVPSNLLVDGNKVPFAYEVDGSTITVTIGPPVNLTLFGKISSDHKTMTLQSAMPVPEENVQFNALIGYYQICTITRTLTQMSDQDDD